MMGLFGTAHRMAVLAQVTPPAPAKPRVRVLANGWVRHDGQGRPLILPAWVDVDVIYRNGQHETRQRIERCPDSWWDHSWRDPQWHVRFYRVSPAQYFSATAAEDLVRRL